VSPRRGAGRFRVWPRLGAADSGCGLGPAGIASETLPIGRFSSAYMSRNRSRFRIRRPLYEAVLVDPQYEGADAKSPVTKPADPPGFSMAASSCNNTERPPTVWHPASSEPDGGRNSEGPEKGIADAFLSPQAGIVGAYLGRCWIAANSWSRVRGLIGVDVLPGFGILISECDAVHTAFMSYPIDLVFMARRHGLSSKKSPLLEISFVVLRVELHVKPWRLPPRCRGATDVLELRCAGESCNLEELIRGGSRTVVLRRIPTPDRHL
jgi:hypothetical protein